MKTFSKFLVGAPLPLLTLLAAGCPTPVVTMDDAGMVGNDTGAMPRDTGRMRDAAMTVLATCEAPRTIMGSLTAAVTISGNTAGGAAGALDVSSCGSDPMGENPPQDVIALQVPGTGPIGVGMDFSAGDADFDMIVQVRTDCATAPMGAGSCFDDADGGLQPIGGFTAMGGSTIFLIISGFANPAMGSTASGAYSGTVRFAPNTPPTLTAASATRDATNLTITGTGMDAESNATGLNVQFLNAAGMPISIAPMNPAAVGPFGFDFDTAPTTVAFTNQAATFPLADLTEGAAAAVAAAVSLRVSAVDEFNQTSATRDVMIVTPAMVGFGAVCDAANICSAPNECFMGTCQAPAAVRTACMAATPVVLVAPVQVATVSAQPVMLATGPGALTNSCGGAGTERIFNVTVPAGGADLIATTNVAATASTVNTVVAIRSTCGNAASETQCNDDYTGHPAGDLRSTATVMAAPAGMYTVIVDSSAALSAAVTAGLELRLRPILVAGAACDPAGEMNRCPAAACPTTGSAVCP